MQDDNCSFGVVPDLLNWRSQSQMSSDQYCSSAGEQAEVTFHTLTEDNEISCQLDNRSRMEQIEQWVERNAANIKRHVAESQENKQLKESVKMQPDNECQFSNLFVLNEGVLSPDTCQRNLNFCKLFSARMYSDHSTRTPGTVRRSFYKREPGTTTTASVNIKKENCISEPTNKQLLHLKPAKSCENPTDFQRSEVILDRLKQVNEYKVSDQNSQMSRDVKKSFKRRAGRGKLRLYSFLIHLLKNPEDYSCIEWVDKTAGSFRFSSSTEIARLWGQQKNKPNMKYENFARSLRTYVAKKILYKPRNKLVYQFVNPPPCEKNVAN